VGTSARRGPRPPDVFVAAGPRDRLGAGILAGSTTNFVKPSRARRARLGDTGAGADRLGSARGLIEDQRIFAVIEPVGRRAVHLFVSSAKQGAGYGYTHKLGYHCWRTAPTPSSAPGTPKAGCADRGPRARHARLHQGRRPVRRSHRQVRDEGRPVLGGVILAEAIAEPPGAVAPVSRSSHERSHG
jgi:hypothetical protein